CFSWEGRQRIHARRNLDGLRRTVNAFLFGGAERQEVLGSLDRILEPPEKLLQVVAALDEIDLRGVDYQEVRGGIAEEEMLVGARDLLDVFEGDLRLLARRLFRDAGAQAFGGDAGEGGLADAQRTFDRDEARRLRAALRN